MAKQEPGQKEQIKVTDKRIFTPEGDIREEFRQEIKPSDPSAQRREPAPAVEEKKASAAPPAQGGPPPGGERRRTLADKAKNPETAFTNFVEPLIAQAYMSLGMLRNPYQPNPAVDPEAARQMIDILIMLEEKTSGNLNQDERDFLDTHLGELKLAFVQRTKNI